MNEPTINKTDGEERAHYDFVDWLKAVGMLLIVYGHCGGHGEIGNPVAPINVKQLGVAFFVCGLGFLLAKEHRGVPLVLFNRLFEIYVIGIATAVVLSVIMLIRIGDPNESNYLPFLLGANVLFDAFPANPTTWYIGTYVHILLFWALLLRHQTISAGWLVFAAIFEIALRAVLMNMAGNFIAYQALPNWLLILMFGYWLGQQHEPRKKLLSSVPSAVLVAASVIAIIGWLQVTSALNITHSNPFGRVLDNSGWLSLILTSLFVTGIYLFWTYIAVALFRRLPRFALIELLSRNTMVVFVVHMPLIYWLSGYVGQLAQGPTRVLLGLMIYYVALSGVSELLMRLVNLRRLRDTARSKTFSALNLREA